MVILIFVFFIIYTIACCMDGPDLKPKWKRWLGLRLMKVADSLSPINFCIGNRCKYYNRAEYELPRLQENYENLLKTISNINSLDSHPKVFVSEFDMKKIEYPILLQEGDLFEARYRENMAKRRGCRYPMPDTMTVEGVVREAKGKCVGALLDTLKQFIVIEEDRETHRPGILVRGSIYVGIKRKMV